MNLCYFSIQVKKMVDEYGQSVKSILPSFCAEVHGWKTLPEAGDQVLEVKNMVGVCSGFKEGIPAPRPSPFQKELHFFFMIKKKESIIICLLHSSPTKYLLFKRPKGFALEHLDVVYYLIKGSYSDLNNKCLMTIM